MSDMFSIAVSGSELSKAKPSARAKYISIFGKIDSLAKPISWATGVSNMLEWLTWSTNDVLGITKTRYWKKIVEWCDDKSIRHASLAIKLEFVRRKLAEQLELSEQSEKYARPASAIASPREVLRRAKYFSEDYLNKEFDIFWTLVSDKYLDTFYGQYTAIRGGGQWATHGNSGLFANSTGIREMQMDNLSYNESEALLVANELKLGGKLNPDQILKYALMFKFLRERNFVLPETRFLLFLISDKRESPQWESLIKNEVAHCRGSFKSTSRAACQEDIIEIAVSAEKATTSWSELVQFNETYGAKLNPTTQQVERKLLSGFNASLVVKEFMNRAAAPKEP